MSDAQHLEFEQPPRRPAKERRKLADAIPHLPPLDVDPTKLQKPDQRSVACVNMKLAGAPYYEIAAVLEYQSAAHAKAAFVAALANMYPTESWEQLRQAEALRAEQQLRRSVAMASADYLVVEYEDEDGVTRMKHVHNTDKLRWHEQAGKDLALHAMITGAKAPSRVEISATVQELNEIASELIMAEGNGGVHEADVFALEELEAEIVEEE